MIVSSSGSYDIEDHGALLQAADFASSLSNPGDHLTFFHELADRWKEIDPQGAMEWAKTLPAGSLRNTAMTTAFESLASVDPVSALSSASTVTDVGSRGKMMAEAAAAWVTVDPAAALLHVTQLEGASGIRALDSAIAQAVKDDPATLATLLSTHPEQFSSIDHTAVSADIARQWADVDLDAAMQWAQALPEGTQREASIAGAASTLANHDPAGARKILDGLPPSDARDASFERTSSDLTSIDPAAAFDWALGINDPELQLSRLTPAIKHWEKIDSDSAENAINDQRLSPEIRTQLRESLAR